MHIVSNIFCNFTFGFSSLLPVQDSLDIDVVIYTVGVVELCALFIT